MIATLIAQQQLQREQIVHGLREGFRAKTEDPSAAYTGFVIVLVLGVLAVAALAVIGMLQRRRQTPKHSHPRRLFVELTRRVQLTGVQRHLLGRMARHLRLEHPAAMLLGPQMLGEYARRWLADIPSEAVRRDTRARLDHISRHLFDSPLAG